MSTELVESLINTHIQRYTEIDILDIYKLLNQAVFGPGHAIKNQKAAREWLERESGLLTPDASAPLVENVHPERAMVRVHLRPYLAIKGDLKTLLDGFVQSSKDINGDTTMMAAWWTIFQNMVKGPLAGRFDARTVALVGRTRASEGWPASHHSPRFEQAHKPAYRVLTAEIANEILRKQRITFSVI